MARCSDHRLTCSLIVQQSTGVYLFSFTHCHLSRNSPMRTCSTSTLLALALASLAGSMLRTSAAHAQSVTPAYAANYTLTNLGTPPGVPAQLGGVVMATRNIMLIGGSANTSNGAIYQINVIRNAQGSITGFDGVATQLSTAAQIDGGLFLFPNGTIGFTTYSNNLLGQIREGQSTPARFTPLSPLGITASTGTATVIPEGRPNAGRLIIGSFNSGQWYITPITPDPLEPGLYTLGPATIPPAFTSCGPEGIVYVPTNSPQFQTPSVLLSLYTCGVVRAYQIDSNGLPNPATGVDFVTGLGGAEGGALDPWTNEFIFSTFGGGNRVIIVRGFGAPTSAPPCNPADIADDRGVILPTFSVNNGVTEGDYNAFFSGFFDSLRYTDIAYDNAVPLPPFGPNGGVNNGVTEGDYNAFFSIFFSGCQ